MRVLLAIDDTDNLQSIGTGRLSRDLAEALGEAGLGECAGVTRHQLLVDPRIPYTSHNSSACLELRTGGPGTEALVAFAGAFLEENFHEGADPGLCVAALGGPRPGLAEFGRLAQREVLEPGRAYALAKEEGVHLSAHGGTGLGIIGALAAVGLRSTGDDGRFLQLRGIREVEGVLSVDELLARTAIEAVRSPDGAPLARSERVDTRGWVRPVLKGGVATLVVERAAEGGWRTPKRNKEKDDG